ncbi:MAG: hypothetical protein KKF54_06740, partial [Candidatus Omnitrophica bacterium]|nr:hypothetical protein [Candidatus Omnitrophota bacterium]
MKYKGIIVSILVIFCGLLSQGKGFAFRINKGSVKIQLAKGETYNGTVEINNPSQEPLGITVYMNDFLYVAPFTGDKEFYPPDSTEFSLAEWVNFSPRQLTIPPFSEGRVNFMVTPTEEFDSARCGVLFFESAMGVTEEEGEIVNILGRIGTLLCVNPKPGNKKVDFYDIKGSNYEIRGRYKNSGDTFLHTEGTYFVMDNEGMVNDRG